MEKKHKLGVIVPYRNRPKDLVSFKSSVSFYLNSKNIDYKIFIIEQDDAKQFNRGMLLNIGFKYAIKYKCDYVVFHDIDMLPLEVDYSYSDKPIHMATNFISKFGEEDRDIFDEYFGGVTMFPVEDFQKINGYSNKYWAWGYEDTDLLLRCVKKEIELDTLKLKTSGRDGASLVFNGNDSLVKCENTIDLNQNATFFISFNPSKLILDHTKESDEFTIFSIPGWDFAVCYNSFHRYNFCAFDSLKNALYVNSKIKPTYKTNITVVLDNDEKIIKVYQDGEFIGETPTFKKLYFYRKEPHFYLGVGKPDREKMENYFKGTLDIFAYFEEKLGDEDIKKISNNEKEYFKKTFDDETLSSFLKIYYNSDHIKNYQLIDLSGNNNNGMIKNCDIIKSTYTEFTEVKIPHRRPSTFDSLIHESNGFLNNKWKDQATRWNQLRFINEVSVNDELLEYDGLSTLEFIEHGIIKEEKIYQITVGI
jgi:hypothetical protein